MSENKDDSNSAPDVQPEESSSATEEPKAIDDSSKDSAKEASMKEESDKEESDKEESDKESDKESDSEEGMGLLDRPVEVTGCRARKKVERLDVSFTAPKEKIQEIPEGHGQKLGDCPRIEHQIQKTAVQELKSLYRVLFGRVGAGPLVKKNIRKFSGFPFENKSAEYDKKKSAVDKFKILLLKQMCEVLDLERGGSKEEIVTRIMDFLMCPKDSGKKVPTKKKSSGKGRKKSSEKKAKNNKKKGKKEVSEDEGRSEDESRSDNMSDKDDEDEESDAEEKKKSKNSKPKKTPKSAAKKVEKKEKAKKEVKKGPAKGTKRKRDEDSDSDDSSINESIAKKTKMPSDDDIKKLVKRILDSADLQEITMKKVIKQVSDAYPDCDLSHKKTFIKTTIKSVIS